jgi:release factor glutamine methyltransferase
LSGPVSPPPFVPPTSQVVARLRAAGCVFAEEEAQLLLGATDSATELADMLARRVAGLPLEHVLGWAQFCGRRIVVGPGVFVPRARTEFLVQQAVALAPRRAVVLDLCCGSGAVGAALAALAEVTELHAADVDAAAVRCARRNVKAAGGRVYQGDLFEPLPPSLRGRVQLLVANVPYVPTDQIALLAPEARSHEPRVALDGGSDGLDVLRRVAVAAPSWLAPGGHLLSETSQRQTSVAAGLLVASGLTARVATSADGQANVVIGTRSVRPR